MKIEESELRKLLNDAFESGFYGCKDIQENVVEELVDRAKSVQTNTSGTITFTAQTPWSVVSGQPNGNGDIFVARPPREVELNVETVRIEANPNPMMSEAIRQMQMQEDHRFFAMMSSEGTDGNENPTIQSVHGSGSQ